MTCRLHGSIKWNFTGCVQFSFQFPLLVIIRTQTNHTCKKKYPSPPMQLNVICHSYFYSRVSASPNNCIRHYMRQKVTFSNHLATTGARRTKSVRIEISKRNYSPVRSKSIFNSTGKLHKTKTHLLYNL